MGREGIEWEVKERRGEGRGKNVKGMTLRRFEEEAWERKGSKGKSR